MKQHHRHVRACRRLARLNLFSLTVLAALLALPLQAQEAADRRSVDARASTTAYTPESSRSDGAATASREKRKPRWFDERRQKADKPAANASFERLSYTRYEGEADQGSGVCVYYQSSYTYSCR